MLSNSLNLPRASIFLRNSKPEVDSINLFKRIQKAHQKRVLNDKENVKKLTNSLSYDLKSLNLLKDIFLLEERSRKDEVSFLLLNKLSHFLPELKEKENQL